MESRHYNASCSLPPPPAIVVDGGSGGNEESSLCLGTGETIVRIEGVNFLIEGSSG
jgi:hypothetical protein